MSRVKRIQTPPRIVVMPENRKRAVKPDGLPLASIGPGPKETLRKCVEIGVLINVVIDKIAIMKPIRRPR